MKLFLKEGIRIALCRHSLQCYEDILNYFPGGLSSSIEGRDICEDRAYEHACARVKGRYIFKISR